MVERRNCSFCGGEIEPGTGSLYIRKDAVSYNFCSNKCRKNQIAMRRIPRRTRWTKAFTDLKAAGLSKEARAKPDEEEAEAVQVKPKAKPTKTPIKTEPKTGPAKAEPAKKPEPKPVQAKQAVAKPASQPKAPASEKPAEAKPKAAKAPAKKPKAEAPK